MSQQKRASLFGAEILLAMGTLVFLAFLNGCSNRNETNTTSSSISSPVDSPVFDTGDDGCPADFELASSVFAQWAFSGDQGELVLAYYYTAGTPGPNITNISAFVNIHTPSSAGLSITTNFYATSWSWYPSYSPPYLEIHFNQIRDSDIQPYDTATLYGTYHVGITTNDDCNGTQLVDNFSVGF